MSNCKHELVIDEGEHVCTLCGTMMGRIIDEGAEWRNYDQGKDEGRTGFTTSDLLPESSYGSVMSFKGLTAKDVKLKLFSAYRAGRFPPIPSGHG